MAGETHPIGRVRSLSEQGRKAARARLGKRRQEKQEELSELKGVNSVNSVMRWLSSNSSAVSVLCHGRISSGRNSHRLGILG